jgi:MobA/VirD2-like, nuclease domain
MIPKGNQRGGGQQLATHLLNERDNERVDVVEVRGAVAQDLHGAFAEWYGQSKGTRCRKYLYPLSINPDHRQGEFTREMYLEFIERTEKKLGLKEQPRAVVFHVKDGREHCHVVWSRIDRENMRAVQISFDRQDLRTLTQDFARDHGLKLPEGMKKNRTRDRFNAHARAENYAEQQQEERTGVSRADRRREIGEAWNEAKDGDGLVRALAARDYYLARGDKRAYVVVDLYGEVHSLAKQIPGVKVRDVKQRLAGYDLNKMPMVKDAQDYARRQREDRQRRKEQENAAQRRQTLEREKESFRAVAERKRAELEAAQKRRREDLDKKRAALEARQRDEMAKLRAMQREQASSVETARRQKQQGRLTSFLRRITGIQARDDRRQRQKDEATRKRDLAQTEALSRRHGREKDDFEHNARALHRVETREKKSLTTELRRMEFREIARPTREQARTATKRDFKENARDVTEAPSPPRQQRHNRTKDKSRELSGAFNGAAQEPAAPPTNADDEKLRDAFNQRAAQIEREREREEREQRSQGPTSAPSPPPSESPSELSGTFNDAAQNTEGSQKSSDADRLRDAFNQRAAQIQRERDRGLQKHHHRRRRSDPYGFPIR